MRLADLTVSILCAIALTGLAGCKADDGGADAGDTDTDALECENAGGWHDSQSGLCWQDPPAGNSLDWQGAIKACDDLSQGGHDDWRLPTISELRSLVRGSAATATGGACGVTDACLENATCWNESCQGGNMQEGPGADGCYWDPALRGDCAWYWSSSPCADDTTVAWGVVFSVGSVDRNIKVDNGVFNNARCVRGDPQ